MTARFPARGGTPPFGGGALRCLLLIEVPIP